MNPMEAFLGGKKGGSEDEPSSRKSGKITFSKPAGFKVPDGIKDGEEFDSMATVKFENGKFVLCELDGTPVDDEYEAGGEAPEAELTETPEEESSEDEAPEETAEPTEPADEEETEGEEPAGFLDAIEKKAKKGNPFKK
jgi:hypothetical protein